MFSKRFGKSKLLREGFRRSPRLSALEDWKASGTRIGAIGNDTSTQQMKRYLGCGQGQSSRTRVRKKRRLTPYDEAACHSPSASPNFGPVESSEEDNQTSSDYQAVCGNDTRKPASNALWLPEKRILELVLDILQRRDTYEIFAEPVNPDEVQDYYEIIEEPMDFGTMRAKLHEGMYKNLQQFEHDALLVTENAMHFNSSATIYFRQAQSIHELAKKVVHILKTYPDKLEPEFLEARLRTRRRAQAEVGKSDSCSKIATNMKPLGMKISGASKAMQYSLSRSLKTRRSPAKTGCSGIDTGEQKLLSGAKDDGRSRSSEADRRHTYRPWKSFLSENESNQSIGMTLSSDLKQLEVNRQDFDYRESLMSFVKDLGPTAKMIARKKILGCSQMQGNQFPLASTSTQPASSTSAAAAPSQGGHPTIVKTTGTTFQLPSSDDQNSSHAQFYQNHRNDIYQLDSYPLRAQTGDRSCIASGYQNPGIKPTAMILNQGKLPHQVQTLVSPSESQSIVMRNLEIASLSNKSCTYKLTLAPQREDYETKAAQGPSHEIRSLSHTNQMTKPDQVNPFARQFTFDLQYLRAQLGKMSNSSGHDRFMQNTTTGELNFSDKIHIRETQYVPMKSD